MIPPFSPQGFVMKSFDQSKTGPNSPTSTKLDSLQIDPLQPNHKRADYWLVLGTHEIAALVPVLCTGRKFKHNFDPFASCAFIIGIGERETNLGSQGSCINMFAGQPTIEKVHTLAVVKGDTIAVYVPTAPDLVNRAILGVCNRIASILTVPLDSRDMNL